MNKIRKVYLFMHPPSRLSQRNLLKPNLPVEEHWKRLVQERAGEGDSAVCIVQGGAGDPGLVESGRAAFGDRCVVDPRDDSAETKVILADDLDRTFGRRGNHGEWNHYEVWSSNNARRWVEGLKKNLAQRAFCLDTDGVEMETFGNWTGCHHKYSNFMATYMGLSAPANKHAEPELSTLKGFPMHVGEFIECIRLDAHVLLYLFRREDGCPMAQFWDGLRPVWEPPHTAEVRLAPDKVELFTFSTNSLIPVNGASRLTPEGFVADVGDGAHPAFTTIVGCRTTREDVHVDYETFRTALVNAEIAPRERSSGVFYAVET